MEGARTRDKNMEWAMAGVDSDEKSMQSAQRDATELMLGAPRPRPTEGAQKRDGWDPREKGRKRDQLACLDARLWAPRRSPFLKVHEL